MAHGVLIGYFQTSGGSVIGAMLGEHSFYHWRKRLRTEEPVRSAVVEPVPGIDSPAATALELVLRNGERLRIGQGADAATLRMVLEAVRG